MLAATAEMDENKLKGHSMWIYGGADVYITPHIT